MKEESIAVKNKKCLLIGNEPVIISMALGFLTLYQLSLETPERDTHCRREAPSYLFPLDSLVVYKDLSIPHLTNHYPPEHNLDSTTTVRLMQIQYITVWPQRAEGDWT